MAHVHADRVKDTSTTTGTGSVTVSGTAPTGYRTFSAVCSTNDTFYYCIAHQSAAEWEVGLGRYSSSNTVARTAILASSNSGSAVSFSSGTKDVFITQPAGKSVLREMLFANRTYYVRTDGSDSNTGLANTAGSAFLTIGKAVMAAYSLDVNGYSVTISVADGTYTISSPISISGILVGGSSTGENITIQGNTTTPGNVVVQMTSGTGSNFYIDEGSVKITGLKLTNSAGSGTNLIEAIHGAYVLIDKVEFGATPTAQIYIKNASVDIYDYTISGSGAQYGIYATLNASFHFPTGKTCTVSGTPAYSVFYIYMNLDASGYYQGTVTNGTNATGDQYYIASNAALELTSGGWNLPPGDSSTGGSDGYGTTVY